ncbi:hypothetical protein UlMin_041647 [Ulmus minor]
MAFQRGDEVEVCSKEEGFVGSYYTAKVISHLPNDLYVVQYDNLVDDNWRDPLSETVRKDEVRPVPPEISPPPSEFAYLEEVDAFDNDGWWVGKITGKTGFDNYSVFFETTGDEIAYPLSRLRFHLEWRNGKWVSSKIKVFS